MPDISRRQFFLGTASIAAIAQLGLDTGARAEASAGFNNGRSQVQSWDLSISGDFPFIDLMKCATRWAYVDNQGEPNPSELNANGYPIKLVQGGVKCITNIFPPSARNGIYVLTWNGNGRLFVGIPNSGTVTPSAGFTSASLTSRSGSGRFEFATTSRDALIIGITSIDGPPISNVRLFHKADEPALNSGQIFGDRFLSVLRNGNPGVIRFLDWASANTTNVTTWATRKPITYFSYSANEYRSSLYAGPTRSSAVKYSSTLENAALVDKTTIQVTFNDNPISVSIGPNATVTWANHGMLVGQPFMFTAPPGTALPAPIKPSSYNGSHNRYWVTSTPSADTFTFSATKGGPNIDTTGGKLTGKPTAFATATTQNVTLSNANPAVVTWADHGLSIGDAVSINSTQSYGMPAPLYNSRTYYVIATGFTTGSFQFSLTPGGAAVSTAGGRQTGQIQAFAMPTLSLNSSPGIPVLSPWGDPSADNGAPFGGTLTSTLVYDADLNGWLKFGGDGGGSMGLANCVPPEIMVALCAEIGAHPHFCAPYLGCDPMTDWHTQLATYVKTNGPPWMKPRFEAPNECWNPSYGFFATRYAWNKSPAHWGASYTLANQDWYGKVVSSIGQAINAVYGGTPSTQTNYAVICAIQTDQAGSNANDPRLTSAAYVAQAAEAQTGYVKSAAYNWATHSCVANYWNPGERDTPTEIVDAYRYAVANNGNPSTQAAIATSYVKTANTNTTINGSPARAFNLISLKGYAVACKAWATRLSSGRVNKMCGYEGGYSPDYPARDSDFNSAITNITKATDAVITLGAFSGNGFAGKGNPAVVGMPVTINGVRGMTQINTPGGSGVTMTAGTPGRVTYVAHGFSAGQAIFFQPQNVFGSLLQGGLIFGRAYYVSTVVDANTFTVSATSGGTPINITGSQVQAVTCVPCWVVTGVSGNEITLNVNSFGFGTASGGQVVWGGAMNNVIRLREAGKFVPAMETYALQLYTDFASAGGEFPSCYFISGAGVIWSVWDPNVYAASTPPQWGAIAAFNH
jgi:hypothetical protein